MGSGPVARRFCSLFLIASIAIPTFTFVSASFECAVSAADAHPLAIKKKKKKKEPPREENQLSEKGQALIPFAFPLPEPLKPNYEFWRRIYSEFDKDHAVFHDTEHLQVVYSVLDFSQPSDDDFLSKGARIRAEKERIRAILEKLADPVTDVENLSPEEKKIYDLFKTVDEPDKFVAAAEVGRIRSQTGQKDKFLKAIEWSGAYLSEIEKIFVSHGLPTDLTRLIFVESMFNPRARSKVGASGLWQFMPGTGRLFMTVNAFIDERNDPFAATHAAARLLKTNYERLGQWPLAINAYNSGALNLAQAMDEMQTDDIGVIAKNYRSGSYKFASRNFYPEFLAALEVANHYKEYFGEIVRDKPFAYENFTVEAPLPLSRLSERCGVDVETLEEMNPAYSRLFFSGTRRLLPAGSTLRIPVGLSATFAEAARNLMEEGSIQVSAQ